MPGVVLKTLTIRHGDLAAVEGLQPEAGEIRVGERRAMIFQSNALWPHLTVAQNVAYGLRFRSGVTRLVEPEILPLDELLSNLDANLREGMRFEIRRLHEASGITTLYVTHDQAEAIVISDLAGDGVGGSHRHLDPAP